MSSSNNFFLLDTNVVSELRKVGYGRVDANFAAWAKTLRWSYLFLSVVTLQELEIGILRLSEYDQPQALILRNWFHNQVLNKFERRILPVTDEIALESARLLVPRNRSVEDALIGATARVHRMKLVTRNVSHFEDCDVEIVNPWGLA